MTLLTTCVPEISTFPIYVRAHKTADSYVRYDRPDAKTFGIGTPCPGLDVTTRTHRLIRSIACRANRRHCIRIPARSFFP